jgi:putative ABC transport system permease protein
VSERSDGGVPARRAVVRWARRLLRREWRQHLLILGLLTAAVAAAIGFTCAAFNLAPASGQADFGDADHFFRFEDPDPRTLPAKLDAAREWFGAIDAIGHRDVPVPGTVKRVDYRSQDPNGPFGRPMLDLRAGRYPRADDEVAVTDWVATTLDAPIGSTIDLDGVTRRVVGLVENPSDLNDTFVLLPPSLLAQSDSVTMLVKAGDEQVDSFRPPGDTLRIISARGDVVEDVVASIITLVVSTLVMFLIALIAAASFTVIAQRRLPQLGMMAAVGATEKHLRLTMLATGAGTGLIAGVVGAVLGLAGWIALGSHLDSAVGFRVDPWNVPWWLVLVGMLLAVVTATAAAWWPGRTMSRIPPVMALSGRPPRPTALDRSAVLAVAFMVGGAICLTIGGSSGDHVTTLDVLLIAVGTLGVVAGVLLVSPIAIRAVARLAGRLPIAGRLALRDLSRYQARSGSALAAISLAVGIPVAVVATAAAAENNVGLGNLSSTQMLIRPESLDGPFVPEDGQVPDLQKGVDALAATLPGSTAVRLDVAKDPGATMEPGLPGIPAISLGRPFKDGWSDLGLVYVASPELLAVYGLDPADIGPDLATSEMGDLAILGVTKADPERGFERLGAPVRLPESYSSLPRTLISPARAQARGWQVVPSGRWLIMAEHPLTTGELKQARQVATQHGFVIETRDTRQGLVNLRRGAVGAGMLLALAILAMTVGLIRSESAGELRTLTATGATRSTRRTITATTAGGLAALGALLGIAGAYLALAAGRLGDLTPLPLLDLAVIAVGTPLAAAAAGWLFAGREPAALARRPIE